MSAKKLLFSVIPMLFLFFVIPSVNAEYNTTTADEYISQISPDCDPVDPRMSCDPDDTNQCLLMVYLENTTCNRGVHVYWSTDGFSGGCVYPNCFELGIAPYIPLIGTPTPITYNHGFNAVPNTSWFPYYHLGYDITFDEGNIDGTDSWFLVVGADTYRFNPALDWTGIPLIAQFWFLNDAAIDDIYVRFSASGFGGADYNQINDPSHVDGAFGLDFNEDNELFVVAYLEYRTSQFGWDWEFVTCEYDLGRSGNYKCGPVGCTGLACAQDTIRSGTYAAGPGGFPPQIFTIKDIMGVAMPNPSGGFKNKVRTNITHVHIVGGTPSSSDDTWDLGGATFPAFTNDGVHHYLNSFLYYINATTGMYKVLVIGNFSSYDTTEVLVYDFDESIAEIIPQSDSKVLGAASNATFFIIWNRESNSTGDGVYFDIERYIPITVEMQTVKIPRENLNATAIITSPGHIQVDSGQSPFTLATPNELNNTLTLLTNKEPQVIIYDFNATDCDGYGVTSLHYNIPYDFEVTVLDIDDATPIPNATVTIDSLSNTTDSNGDTVISINPITDVTFTILSFNCSAFLIPNATSRVLDVDIVADGYLDFEAQIEPASDPINPSTAGAFFMLKTGARLEVSLESTTGVEISPCGGYVLTVTGANRTYHVRQGISIFTNTIYEFPATIRFEDDRQNFTVNLTMQLPDSTFINTTKLMIEDTTQYHTFYAGQLGELKCTDVCDCPESTCVGQYHAELRSCISGSCNYTVTDCGSPLFCDDRVGCFQIETNTQCDLLLDDPDVLCSNSCLNNQSMIWGRCGSDSLCKNITVLCDTFCNVTIGSCDEFKLCLAGETQVFKVQLSPAIQTITCDFSNIGDTFCLNEATVDKSVMEDAGLTADRLATIPDGWYYTEENDTIRFWAPLVTCSDTCEPTWEFCEHTCDEDLGICIGRGIGVPAGAASARAWIDALYGWWIALFPTIWDQAFMWTIITLLISFGFAGGIAYVQRGGGGLSGQEVGSIFIGSAIAFFLLGIFIGTMPFFMGVIFAILAGFLIWRIWSG